MTVAFYSVEQFDMLVRLARFFVGKAVSHVIRGAQQPPSRLAEASPT